MPNAGPSPLVDGCGLKAAELRLLKLLSERLFDALAENLAAITGKPSRAAALTLELQNSDDFFVHAPRHFTVVGLGDEPALILRIDMLIACALVRAALGGDPAGLAETAALTPIESRVLARAVPQVFVDAVERVFSDLFLNRPGFRVLYSSESEKPVVDRFKGAQFVIAAVECAIGDTKATAAFALPLSIAVSVRSRLTSTRPDKRPASLDAERVKKALASCPLELRAVLGSVPMSLGEIRSLGPGSVVVLQKLERSIPRVTLRCGERTLLSGTVVEDAGWYRFLVQAILEGEHLNGDTNAVPAA